MKRWIITTVILWVVLTVTYGYTYIVKKASLPGNEGYEKWLNFQLVMFLILRFPLLVIMLIILLSIIYVISAKKYVRKKKFEKQ